MNYHIVEWTSDATRYFGGYTSLKAVLDEIEAAFQPTRNRREESSQPYPSGISYEECETDSLCICERS